MRFIGDIAEDAEVRAIASGAITDGEPVVINSAGTVSGVTDAIALALGSEVAYITNTSYLTVKYNCATFDSTNNRVVIAFKDGTEGKAVVGTVSGTSISFGTPVQFESGGTDNISLVHDTNSNRIVIGYTDDGDSGKAKFIVGTVDSSDNSISFGSIALVNNATSNGISLVFDSNSNKVVYTYINGSDNVGKAVVGTVDSSDNSMSLGSHVAYHNASTTALGDKHATFDSNSNKVVIAFQDNDDSSKGKAVVGTVSGTSISFGSEVEFNAAGVAYLDAVFDSSNNKIVIIYRDAGNSNYGTAIVGTVSGTSISFGTEVVFESGNAFYVSATYDASTGKIVASYKDLGNSNQGTYNVGTVSGTGISFSGAAVFNNTNTEFLGSTYDSNAEKVVIVYKDAGSGDNDFGSAIVLQNAVATTLTSENFIGIANAAYADGQKATVKTTGSIARNVPQVASASGTVGSATQYVGTGGQYQGITYDTNANRFLIAYRDASNSNYGTAVVANISGGTLSYGTPVVFENAAVQGCSVAFDSNANKVAIFYVDGGNSSYGTAIVATIDPSDNSVTFGTAVVFSSSSTGMDDSSSNAVFVPATPTTASANKVVVGYTDSGDSQTGKGIVGTISGTDISFGTAVKFNNARTSGVALAYDLTAKRISIAFKDRDDSNKGIAVVGTVSNTDISFGSEVEFDSGPAHKFGSAFDPDTSKVIITYQDNGDSNHAKAVIGTISSTSISFGTPVTVLAATSNETSVAYDTTLNKVVVSVDDGGGTRGIAFTGTVSGTSISFDSGTVFETNQISHLDSAFDPDNGKVVIVYDVSAGKGVVYSPAGTPEDLTIGQQYFVQTDGTLGTSADDPSVIAGTAIGASDIVVKG